MSTVVVNKRIEPFDIYIGRGSVWGNIFTHLPSTFAGTIRVVSRGEAISRHRDWLLAQGKDRSAFAYQDGLVKRIAAGELTNRRLGCYCAPQACHGDLLAALANHLDLTQRWIAGELPLGELLVGIGVYK